MKMNEKGKDLAKQRASHFPPIRPSKPQRLKQSNQIPPSNAQFLTLSQSLFLLPSPIPASLNEAGDGVTPQTHTATPTRPRSVTSPRTPTPFTITLIAPGHSSFTHSYDLRARMPPLPKGLKPKTKVECLIYIIGDSALGEAIELKPK
ncbi:hypothetical protein LguiA_015859 [Lonicera macranthoides]